MIATKLDSPLDQLVHVDALENHIPLLPEKDRKFAGDLVGNFKKYKNLSAAQMMWVMKLTLRAQGFEEPSWRKIAGFDPLRKYLLETKELSSRAAKLEVGTALGLLVLRPMGNKAKYPNSIALTNGGKFGVDQAWYGFIDTAGSLNMRYTLSTEIAGVITTTCNQLQESLVAT